MSARRLYGSLTKAHARADNARSLLTPHLVLYPGVAGADDGLRPVAHVQLDQDVMETWFPTGFRLTASCRDGHLLRRSTLVARLVGYAQLRRAFASSRSREPSQFF